MYPAVQPFDQDDPYSRTWLNIGPYGKFTSKYSPQKPLGQLQPSFGGMVLGWPPSKIVSIDPNFQPRFAAKLKIEKGGGEI
jgi:hypothetical protein